MALRVDVRWDPRYLGNRTHEQPMDSRCQEKSHRRRARRAWGLVLRTVPRRAHDLSKRIESQGGRRGSCRRTDHPTCMMEASLQRLSIHFYLLLSPANLCYYGVLGYVG